MYNRLKIEDDNAGNDNDNIDVMTPPIPLGPEFPFFLLVLIGGVRVHNNHLHVITTSPPAYGIAITKTYSNISQQIFIYLWSKSLI